MSVRRDWTAANAKLRAELPYGCRVCGRNSELERAHVLGRALDEKLGAGRRVDPDLVVWLCGPFPSGCHGDFDLRSLDLMPYLTDRERDAAFRLLGEGPARRSISGRAMFDQQP